MGKSKSFKLSNILLVIVIVLLLIPQTRTHIQVLVNKGIALVNTPSVVDVAKRKQLANYHWTLQDLSGNTRDFNDLKGQVVIVNFWATWCPPCIAEMPSFEALYQHYQTNSDLVFLFVSNENPEVVNEFMTRKGCSFEVFRPLTDAPEEFDVSSIPRTFVIDKNGGIVIDKSGAVNWNSASVRTEIDNLLKAF